MSVILGCLLIVKSGILRKTLETLCVLVGRVECGTRCRGWSWLLYGGNCQ